MVSEKQPRKRGNVLTTLRLGGVGMLAIILIACCVQPAFAIPADPSPIEFTQPDGASITLHLRGDERFHWYEDLQGFTVVHDRGAYVYAKLDPDGSLAPTTHLVGVANPAEVGLTPRILPAPPTIQRIRAGALKTSPVDNGPTAVPPEGNVKNLVVLCRFSDHTFGTHTRAESDYDVLFNAVGGHPTLAPTGSVRDLYFEDSYGQMTLVSTIAPWVTLPEGEGYYTDSVSGFGDYPQNAQGMVEDALDAVDAVIDFGEFDSDNDGYIDAITIIHSGYGDEALGNGFRIWSHRWSLWQLPDGEWISQDRNSEGEFVKVYDYHTEPALWGRSGNSIVRFGVIAHETGHFFGLPDLYDTSGSSEGIGSYCMMANSWGFDFSQLHPPHFSAWCKIFLGWVEPTRILEPGTYSAPQVATSPTIYRIDFNYPIGEYLLIENRQPVGHESAMPQGGLCIWHIDEAKSGNTEPGYVGQSGWPQNNKHYKVALLQADGSYGLERGWNRGDSGDVYHADGVDTLDNTTVPNTDAYQNGIIIDTHNAIRDIGPAGANMQFTFTTYVDCNNNATSDFDDIDAGTSIDCNANLVPDECEADCNENGIHDDCDVASGFAEDCQADGVPDECQVAGTDLPFNGPADRCEDAMAVTSGVQYFGETNGMDVDGTAECGDSDISPDVWYRYAPIAGGLVTVSLCGSGYDTVLSVHDACPGTADNEIVCNDDTCGVQSEVSWSAQAGSWYYIRVSGWHGSAGTYVMTITGTAGGPSETDCNVNGRPDVCENLLPRIDSQPDDAVAAIGHPAEFRVEADGIDLSYQWQHDGENIPDATQAAFRIEQIDWEDVGSYRVRVISPCGTSVSEAATLTAKLGVFVNVEGSGQIEMEPPGGVYAPGALVKLTPVPEDGWMFQGWSGGVLGASNPIYVRVLENVDVSAKFVPIHNVLTLLTDGQGEVSIIPTGGDYAYGQEVRIRATPAEGWRFAGWEGMPNDGRSSLTLTMEGDLTVVAKFEQLAAAEAPTTSPPIVPSTCGSVGPALVAITGLMLGLVPMLRRRR